MAVLPCSTPNERGLALLSSARTVPLVGLMSLTIGCYVGDADGVA